MIEQHNGTYLIFEGPDFCGKSTLATAVAAALAQQQVPTLLTKHPGATPLGCLLRKLVKEQRLDGQQFEIDDLSAQLLLLVDQIAFINSILRPALRQHQVVLADRCNFVSAIAYGLADDLSISTIHKLLRLIQSPTPDRIFILHAPSAVLSARKMARTSTPGDRWDDKDAAYLQRLVTLYEELLTGSPETILLLEEFVPLENIVYLDATQSIVQLTTTITAYAKTCRAGKLARA
jgi:dTMP kinase